MAMNDANIIFHLLLRLLELAAISFFMAGTMQRCSKAWGSILLNAGCAALMVAARVLVYQIPFIQNEFVYITFVYYFLIFLYLIAKYRISAKKGVYNLLLVFLCVHALRQTVGTAGRILHGSNPMSATGTMQIPLRLMYYGLYFALCCATLYIVKSRMHYKKERTWKQITWLLIGIVPVVYLTNLGLVMGFGQQNLNFSTILVAQVCSYCGFVIVLGYDNALALNEKKQDIARMEAMLDKQREQYKLKQETVDILNRRYHDFKNHILYLDAAEPSVQYKAYLKSIEEDIRHYDNLCQTGNEALDIILTNKTVECANAGVRLLLLMNGRLLSFMKPMDLVSIFGNAIDNARRALMEVEAVRREIIVRTLEKENWIVLRFENEYVTQLHWQGSKLVSTKVNPDEHGQGICIIERTAAEYGGNVSIDAAANRFALNILFPQEKQRRGK